MPDRADAAPFVAAVQAAVAGADAVASAALWHEAVRVWPAIEVEPGDFARHVVAAGTELATVRGADLYLACACCRGDGAAIAELERMFAPIRAVASRAGYDAAIVDDALQTVRYRLLVATPHREAKLATYRGRGSLAGWLRVVALRQLRALSGPRPDRSDSALAAVATEADATLAVLVRTHGPLVRRLFRDALALLDDRDRELLRLEIVDELPHQRIAEIHGVHRTTALRWIEDARRRLAREVRRRLKRELALGDASLDSLLGALANHVELSLGSGLLAGGASPR